MCEHRLPGCGYLTQSCFRQVSMNNTIFTSYSFIKTIQYLNNMNPIKYLLYKDSKATQYIDVYLGYILKMVLQE